MVSIIKSMVFCGAIATGVVIAFILMRGLLRWIGRYYLSKRDFHSACIFFSTAGLLLFDSRARIYRNYCLFRKGKIDVEAMRECIECSTMAYSNEGYELLQKINQVAHRREK